jgi:hypothetical protein
MGLHGLLQGYIYLLPTAAIASTAISAEVAVTAAEAIALSVVNRNTAEQERDADDDGIDRLARTLIIAS